MVRVLCGNRICGSKNTVTGSKYSELPLTAIYAKEEKERAWQERLSTEASLGAFHPVHPEASQVPWASKRRSHRLF